MNNQSASNAQVTSEQPGPSESAARLRRLAGDAGAKASAARHGVTEAAPINAS